MRRRSSSAAGFTLIELVVVIAVLGIAAGMFAGSLEQGMGLYGRVRHRQDIVGEGTGALDRLRRELREVRAATDLGGLDPGRLVYTPPGGAAVTCEASGGILTLDGRVLARDVTAFAVAYRRRNGAAAGAVAEVWWLHLSLTLARHGEVVTARSAVHPRSFRPEVDGWAEQP